MMNLNKKLFRDLRSLKGQFIAITVVIIIGAFFFTGFSNFARNLSEYANTYFDETNLADLWAYYSDLDPEDLKKFSDIEAINGIEGRYVMSVNQNFQDIKTTLKLHSITDDNEINSITILEGKTPQNSQSIIIDSDYAKEHNYKIGNKMVISTMYEEYELVISGLCESSEYTIKSRDTSDFPPNHKEYGIAFISEEAMFGIIGKRIYNEVLFDLEDNFDLKSVESQIEKQSENLNFLYILRREAGLSYRQFTSEISQQEEFAKILPLIFFGVAALITFLTLSRVVDSQRLQIGVMKALGIQTQKIVIHYMGYAFIPGIVGGIIGSVMGAILFPKIFMDQVTAIISLPYFKITIYYSYVFISILLSVVFGMLAAYISCRTVLKENAAEAMRQKPPKNVKKTLIEQNSAFWSRLSYNNKLILRNIFLNKKRVFFSSLGIICCVAFLILAFGYKGSRSLLIEKQFTEVYDYDLRVVFKEPVMEADMNLPKDTLRYNTTVQTSVIISNLEDKRDINLIITDRDSKSINNYDNKGNILSLSDTGVIIAERFAETHNLEKGDKLTLKLIDPAYKGLQFDVEISGISVQYLNQDIYCTYRMMENNGVIIRPDTLLITLQDDEGLKTAYESYNAMENVKEVKSKKDVRSITEGGLQNLYNMIIVLIVCAVILSAAAIYNISVININERIRELATLKVLGYQRSRIRNIIFKENIIITIFSIVIGTPLGIEFYKLILKKFTLDNMVFPIYVEFTSVLQPLIITLLVTIICNFLLDGKIKRINMIESLKSID